MIPAEEFDVAVVFTAGLLAGADGVRLGFSFAGGAEGVLGSGVDLALELEEVGNVQVFGFEPLEERLVFGDGAGEVDVIITGKPVFGGFVPAGEGQVDGFGFAGFEGEGLGDGGEEEATVGFDFVVAGGRSKVAVFESR